MEKPNPFADLRGGGVGGVAGVGVSGWGFFPLERSNDILRVVKGRRKEREGEGMLEVATTNKAITALKSRLILFQLEGYGREQLRL